MYAYYRHIRNLLKWRQKGDLIIFEYEIYRKDWGRDVEGNEALFVRHMIHSTKLSGLDQKYEHFSGTNFSIELVEISSSMRCLVLGTKLAHLFLPIKILRQILIW